MQSNYRNIIFRSKLRTMCVSLAEYLSSKYCDQHWKDKPLSSYYCVMKLLSLDLSVSMIGGQAGKGEREGGSFPMSWERGMGKRGRWEMHWWMR